MGLHRGVFHPDWVYHHRPTVDSAMLARVLIERVDSTVEPEYDFDTGEYVGNAMTPLYLGIARVQKRAFPTTRDFVQDTAKFQRMQVQISLNGNELPNPAEGVLVDIHVNDRVTLLTNPADPGTEGETYYVHGDGSSSNPWLRNLTCQNNMKQDTY